MNIDLKLEKIFDKARSSIALTREDCAFLLSFDEKSYESALIRATANDVVRKKTDNSAIILGQIGVDVRPCPGRCKFCTFGELHTKFEPSKMSEEELEQKMHEFCDKGDLYGLYLMTMHEYDLDNYLRIVEHARKVAPATTQIWANIGDSSYEDLKAIHDAGVSGIYHVCRLREGEDTELDPKDRIRTMENAKKAGLELYTCCEPIGPEHTIEELVENIFIGVEMGVYQHAAMRRVAVPGAPLAERGQISELRLAHIAACIALLAGNVHNGLELSWVTCQDRISLPQNRVRTRATTPATLPRDAAWIWAAAGRCSMSAASIISAAETSRRSRWISII